MNQYVLGIFLGLFLLIALVAIVTTISDVLVKRKLAQQWKSNRRIGGKLDSEESLVASLMLDKDRQLYDSFVDDQTWQDLSFYETFKQIDGAQSSLGSENLYSRLRLLCFSEDSSFETLQDFLSQHPKQRLEMQLLFAKLGKKNHNQAKKLVYHPVERNHQLYLYCFLGALPLLSLFLVVLNSKVALLLFIGSLTFNILFSIMGQWSLNLKLENMNYLVKIFYVGMKISKINFPRQNELERAVKPFSMTRILGSVFQGQSGLSEFEVIFLYLNMIFLIPHIAQAYISNKILKYQNEAEHVLDILGELETAISVLHYKEHLELVCQPNFSTKRGIIGRKLYHPLLNNPVANDVTFCDNMVISGDNASGKSTYLRTVAINALIAQSLGFAYAETLSLSYGHVLSAMDVTDDIETGDSYFITESRAIKRMLDSLEHSKMVPHYFFIDELFKGTNTIERIGAGLGIIQWLAEHPCLYMISSHDIELVVASGVVNANYHFDSQYIKGQIVFDYKIKSGSAVTKNAVHTLESLCYPEEITETAKKMIAHYEASGHWDLNVE
ncbi:MutS-related protein [Streptococcus anginosus]|uniref:MutS-related protein n=1 Tax=Streptococcus anginosus TaxID=1328 RepID=UPI0029C45903|nr:hypothetical protein [Streptococcus anginosus]MDX5016262.1 hypothetical protein [Streptococcus anginosus]MDX5020299.1 hypothetical protein [Streptococcus anginosus]